MKKYFFLVLFLIPAVSAELYINEVMYNPDGYDNNKEFVEVYTDLDLSGFVIQDSASSDILELVKENNESNFSLIVEEGFDYTNLNATIYSVGATIGNNLNNERDFIVIKNLDDEILDVFSYTNDLGANGNGLSLCRVPDKTGIFKECDLTPGSPNSKQEERVHIKINEFLPNPEGDDNAKLPEGEKIELFNLGEEDANLEEFVLVDDFGHRLTISDSHVIETTIIPKEDYLVIYTNGKSGFLNNEGFERVKLLSPSGDLIDEVSYSDSQEGVSWAFIEGSWYKSRPSFGFENPQEKEDVELDSQLTIENVYLGRDDKAKWGDGLRVKLRIYKGNTSKNAVYVWLSKNDKTYGKRTLFSITERFKEQEITVPIQIPPNCKQTYADGNYYIIASGLNAADQRKIKVIGLNSALCSQVKNNNPDFTYELLDFSNSLENGEAFKARVRITNNLNVKKEFTVWAQIKDGKKDLIKKKTKEKISLPGGTSAIIDLEEEIGFVQSGKYDLRLNLLEEGKKRPRSINDQIEISGEVILPISETHLNDNTAEKITGQVVYESKTNKQRKLTLYIFIGLLALLAIYGVVRRD